MSSPPVTGNKKELARALHVTAPTLDRWLERFGEEVPVLRRGSNGKPYLFDIAADTAFFLARQAEEVALTAARDEQLAQLAIPGLVPDGGAVTQREIGLALDNEGKRQKLQLDRHRLVIAAEISAALTAAIAAAGAAFDSIVPRVAAKHPLPPIVVQALTDEFATARANLVRALQGQIRELDASPA
jgi:hypothetical protein